MQKQKKNQNHLIIKSSKELKNLCRNHWSITGIFSERIQNKCLRQSLILRMGQYLWANANNYFEKGSMKNTWTLRKSPIKILNRLWISVKKLSGNSISWRNLWKKIPKTNSSRKIWYYLWNNPFKNVCVSSFTKSCSNPRRNSHDKTLTGIFKEARGLVLR